MDNKGWLVVNNYIAEDKFTDLYNLFLEAAASKGMELALVKTGDIPYNVQELANTQPAFVIFWDKDIVLARFLESAGIRVFNAATAIEYCDNKALTTLALERADVPLPRTTIAPLTFEGVGYTDLAFAAAFAEKVGYPLVVKECFGSFGKQVHLVASFDELKALIPTFGSRSFLLQEFVAESTGRDLRIFVVGDETPIAMNRFNASGDFRSNITLGGYAQPHVPTDEEASIALNACKALGLDFGAVDLLLGKSGPLVCEVNSNPHFRSALDCTQLNLAEFILDHIRATIEG